MGVVLAVEGLSVDFLTSRGRVHALRDVSLRVPRGRIVGIVGESGSGKSTLVLAALALLPNNA
jgi:ABC-type glutathione transport system ATPase component